MLFPFWIAPSIQVTAQSWWTSLRSSPFQTHDPWNVWQNPYRGKSLAFCSQARQPFYHQRSFIFHNSPLYLTNRLLRRQEKQQNGFNSTTSPHRNLEWNPWAGVPTHWTPAEALRSSITTWTGFSTSKREACGTTASSPRPALSH